MKEIKRKLRINEKSRRKYQEMKERIMKKTKKDGGKRL